MQSAPLSTCFPGSTADKYIASLVLMKYPYYCYFAGSLRIMYSVAATIREHSWIPKNVWGKPAEQVDVINGDRREDRRYHLQLELKWKLIRRRRVLDTGTGHTLDVSSGGILFDAGRHLPEGLNVELSIAWPVLLHNVAPMQLVAAGKIIRCNGRQVAIQTTQHEFRTTGIPAEQRSGHSGSSQNQNSQPSHALQRADAGRHRQTLSDPVRLFLWKERIEPGYLPRLPMTGSGTGGAVGGASSSTGFLGRRFRISLMNSSRALAYFGVPGLGSMVAHSSGVIS